MMEEEERSSKPWVSFGLGVVAVLALAAVVYLKMSKLPMVPAPTAFGRYTAADKSFACLSPTGWTTAGAASHGIAGGARFENGLAKIDITSDLAGSLMADIVKSNDNMAGSIAGMAGLPAPAQKPPVEKLHLAAKQSFTASFKEYEEGQMGAFQSSLGDARFSEFTANKGFPVGKIHGFRVTILSGERRTTVVCQCPEQNWATLKPAFQRVIGSMASGGA